MMRGRMRRIMWGPAHRYVFRPSSEMQAYRLKADCAELRTAMQFNDDPALLLEQWWELERKDCLLHYIAIGERLGDEIEYGPLSCLCNFDGPDERFVTRCHPTDPWRRPWPAS